MQRATSLFLKKESTVMPRIFNRGAPLFINTNRRGLHSQDFLSKHGPKIFGEEFGSHNISGLEEKTVEKHTPLIGSIDRFKTTKENPGVFLYRNTEHNELRAIEEAEPIERPNGPTIHLCFFQAKDKVKCWQAHTHEADVGIDTAKKILISPEHLKAAKP